MCLHCKLRTVLLRKATNEDARPDKSLFECPSCFKIISAPVSYVVNTAQ